MLAPCRCLNIRFLQEPSLTPYLCIGPCNHFPWLPFPLFFSLCQFYRCSRVKIATVAWLPHENTEPFVSLIQPLRAHRSLAHSRPSVGTHVNDWLAFFPANIMSGTEQILSRGVWKESTRWPEFPCLNLPHWGDPWLLEREARQLRDELKWLASGKVHPHQNSSSVAQCGFLARDADSFSETADWSHSCPHFICKPSLSLFPFLPPSAFRRGGAADNSTRQFLWINSLTGCFFQSPSLRAEYKCLLSLEMLSLIPPCIHSFGYLLIHLRNQLFHPADGAGSMWIFGSCLKQEFMTWDPWLAFSGSFHHCLDKALCFNFVFGRGFVKQLCYSEKEMLETSRTFL